VDQVVIRVNDARDEHFELYPGMRPEQLQMRVAAAGVDHFTRAWLHCDDSHWKEFTSLLQAAWPEKQMERLPDTEPGIHQVKGRVIFRFGDHYFRAIAKIAFHYYLTHSRRGTRGDEREFESVRQFIMNGGDPTEFFPVDLTRFAMPFGKLPDGGALMPSKWCHILCADESSGDAVVYVHLFAGPKSVRKGHHLRLGRVPGSIIVPGSVNPS